MSLTDAILTQALSLGFDRAAAIPVGVPRYGVEFKAWLNAGYHGDLAYLAARTPERLDPRRWAPDAHSMLVLAANYDPGSTPPDWSDPAHGRIARYAWQQDYHDMIKPKLYALDAFIRGRTGRQTPGKVFVDSAPVLERDFAAQAGLGFIGRNCCLITPELGSWTALAGLMVPEDLTPSPSPAARDASDPARRGESDARRGESDARREESDAGRWQSDTKGEETDARRGEADTPPRHREGGLGDGCGRCTRCLDACPARAFVGPHVLDARRCISYLTIELRGPIPRDLRPLMGNWVFGCDVCQEICPYNRQASAGRVRHAEQVGGAKPGAADRQRSISLSELLVLDEAGFRARFRGTPVLRAKRRGLVRNACVAAGNSGDPVLAPALSALLADPEPLVRGHAAWALRRIGGARAENALAHALVGEPDPWVRSELAS